MTEPLVWTETRQRLCNICGALIGDPGAHRAWHLLLSADHPDPDEAVPPQVGEPEGPTFKQELVEVINRHSMEGGSNTPDFILADFLGDCLAGFEYAVRQRNRWYGRKEGPE